MFVSLYRFRYLAIYRREGQAFSGKVQGTTTISSSKNFMRMQKEQLVGKRSLRDWTSMKSPLNRLLKYYEFIDSIVLQAIQENSPAVTYTSPSFYSIISYQSDSLILITPDASLGTEIVLVYSQFPLSLLLVRLQQFLLSILSTGSTLMRGYLERMSDLLCQIIPVQMARNS